MNIKKKVRELLVESTKRDSYGCVMLYLDIDKKKWDKVTSIVDKEDLYNGKKEEDKDSYGIENNPHVTILFGLHKDVLDSKVDELLADVKKPSIELKGVSAFLNDDFDVLKFDINSPSLVALNKKFTDNVEYTTEYKNYHAHVTIAYIKKGTSEKYIKILNEMKPLDITPDRIIYSKFDKSKKEYKLKN